MSSGTLIKELHFHYTETELKPRKEALILPELRIQWQTTRLEVKQKFQHETET